MATKNHNFRFNTEKEQENRAWDLLHSKEVKQSFKSQNEFVIMAINDYYDRHLLKKDDPYLETREKEEAFADRIVQMAQEKMFANMPALVGMYLMGQQNFTIPVMKGAYSSDGAEVNASNNRSMESASNISLKDTQTTNDSPKESLAAEELPENEFLDENAW